MKNYVSFALSLLPLSFMRSFSWMGVWKPVERREIERGRGGETEVVNEVEVL